MVITRSRCRAVELDFWNVMLYNIAVVKGFDAQISLPACEWELQKEKHSVQFSLVISLVYLKENCTPIKLIELVE